MPSHRGYALLSVVVVTAVLMVVGAATIQLSRSELRSTADHVGLEKAVYIAEAGVHRGLAQLEQDLSTAAASTAYTYAVSESFADGSYSISVVQDPIFPNDPGRKRIESTGTVASLQSTTVVHVQLNDPAPHVCFSDAGDCRFVTNIPAATDLFNGAVYAGKDVVFEVLIGGLMKAAGNVFARNNVVTTGLLDVLSPTDANAYYQGSYQNSFLDVHLSSLTRKGVHFANPPGNGHGQQQVVNQRPFPRPDYDRIAHQPTTVVVSEEDPNGGTWDSASNTWVFGGTLAAPADETTVYYVNGNADITTIQLARGARLRMVTRGWLVFQSLTLLTTSIIPGSEQVLELVAERDLAIGRAVTGRTVLAPDLQSQTLAMADPTNGIALGGSLSSTTTRIFAYSEKGFAWTKASSVTALSRARLSVFAKGDATIAFTGSIASEVKDITED